MSKNGYRVNLKVRNEHLLSAIEKRGFSAGVKFADKVGVPYHILNALISMKIAPIEDNGDLKPEVEKLCLFLNKSPSVLFDFDQMHNPLEVNCAEFDTDLETILSIRDAQNDFELKHILKDKINELKPREQEFLKLRFGLDGGEHTLKECGELFGVTGERMRQLEATALRKLRRATRSIGLKDYLK